MIVVDAKYAVVGSINIADRYNDCPNIKAWLDFAIFPEGTIAKELFILSWKTWSRFKISNPSTFHEDTHTICI